MKRRKQPVVPPCQYCGRLYKQYYSLRIHILKNLCPAGSNIGANNFGDPPPPPPNPPSPPASKLIKVEHAEQSLPQIPFPVSIKQEPQDDLEYYFLREGASSKEAFPAIVKEEEEQVRVKVEVLEEEESKDQELAPAATVKEVLPDSQAAIEAVTEPEEEDSTLDDTEDEQLWCRYHRKRFKSHVTHKQHMDKFHKKPSASKDWICCYCGGTEDSRIALVRHMVAAHQELFTSCGICSTPFNRGQHALQCQRQHITGKGTRLCSLCPIPFFNKSYLARHLEYFHGEPGCFS